MRDSALFVRSVYLKAKFARGKQLTETLIPPLLVSSCLFKSTSNVGNPESNALTSLYTFIY